MTDIQDIPQEAARLAQSGRFEEAEALCRQALELTPDNGGVRFALGCAYIRAGRPADGLPALQEAARLLPSIPDAHIVLGAALISVGQWSAAAEALSRAVELKPDFLPAKINLALALHSSGRPAEAERLYNEICDALPDNQEARSALAHILNEQMRFEEAEPHARIAVDLAPESAASFNILGNALYGLGRMEEAVIAYGRSLALAPNSLQTCLNLFNALNSLQRFVEAEEIARQALAMDPTRLPAVEAEGMALIALDRYDEAMRLLERAMRNHPKSESPAQLMAVACSRKGLFEEAVTFGLRAVEINSTMITRCSLGLDQLRTGRYVEGWRNYEERVAGWALAHFCGIPKWDGRPLEGRSLYVFAEGGLGDTIQFARFLPLVAERAGGPVFFACQSELVEPLADVPGIGTIAAHPPGPLPPPGRFDCQISLQSLPWLFGTTEETIPSPLLPVRVSKEATEMWSERLSGLQGLKVGLRWAGNPTFDGDRYRSLHLDTLAPLAAFAGVSFISLQIGPPADDIRSGTHRLDILHESEGLSDFTQTAALLRQLDLVISTCTSVPHLAGALDVETWLLLPFVPNWCWNIYRPDDTPWYPRHRLFRQPRLHDWESVVERVCASLAARVAGGQGVSKT